jgi:hypothetical protein
MYHLRLVDLVPSEAGGFVYIRWISIGVPEPHLINSTEEESCNQDRVIIIGFVA